MADEQKASRGRPWGKLILALSLVLGLALVAALGVGYALVQQQLQRVEYQARILSVAPDDGCVAMLRDMGSAVVNDLSAIITKLPFPVGVDPETLKKDAEKDEEEEEDDAEEGKDSVSEVDGGTTEVSDVRPEQRSDVSQALQMPETSPPTTPDAVPDTPDAGNSDKVAKQDDAKKEADEDEESDCNATMTMRIEVTNPLPLAMHARIIDVEVRVARRPLRADQIRYASPELEAEGGGVLAKEVTFHMDVQQIMAAASGILLRQKLPLAAQARIKVTVLGGLMSRELVLPVAREVTVRELLEGFTQGTLVGEEVEESDEQE